MEQRLSSCSLHARLDPSAQRRMRDQRFARVRDRQPREVGGDRLVAVRAAGHQDRDDDHLLARCGVLELDEVAGTAYGLRTHGGAGAARREQPDADIAESRHRLHATGNAAEALHPAGAGDRFGLVRPVGDEEQGLALRGVGERERAVGKDAPELGRVVEGGHEAQRYAHVRALHSDPAEVGRHHGVKRIRFTGEIAQALEEEAVAGDHERNDHDLANPGGNQPPDGVLEAVRRGAGAIEDRDLDRDIVADLRGEVQDMGVPHLVLSMRQDQRPCGTGLALGGIGREEGTEQEYSRPDFKH
jgi:hypothetical protein